MKDSISRPIARLDAALKLSGKAKYIADYQFENLLYARTIRSSEACAKILNLVIPPLPLGYFLVNKEDISGLNRMKTVISDHPIFAEDEVSYIGQPIMLLVGPDRERLWELAQKVEIDYQPMDGIFTLEDSEANDHAFTEYQISKGDADKAFAEAAEIISESYRTGSQEHVYLEPNGIAAEYKEGQIFVYGSMQCPFYAEGALELCLGWDKSKIRVIQTTTGGAFGGKEEFPSLTACHVALAAIKSAHPVMMIYDRDEDIIVSTKRHPSLVRLKAALDSRGNISALDIDLLYDAGAYSGLSPVVLQRGIFNCTGVYNIPNLKARGRNMKTNTVPSGAYRGFGAPQSIFAIEMLLQQIAESHDFDPLEYKMRHILKKGDKSSTNGTIRDEVLLPEIVNKLVSLTNYHEKYRNNKPFHGIGISLFLHGCGFTGAGESLIQGKVILRKNGDLVRILVSSVEMGQGADSILSKIVAHELQIPLENVRLEPKDTGIIPDSGPTVASRTTMIVGGLLQSAAKELKKRWNEAEDVEISKVYSHPSHLQWNNDIFEGDAYPTYSWGANVVELSVNPITFELNLEKITAVYDVGAVIDERALLGQMHGGIAQGAGWASIEVLENHRGKILQNNLTDYKVPTSMDIPEIHCEFINNPYEYGPFGAKCAGELPFVGPAPAIAAAVSHALNRKITKIPIQPEDLL